MLRDLTFLRRRAAVPGARLLTASILSVGLLAAGLLTVGLPAAAPAHAQMEKHDSSQPIEVVSDQLEVQQNKNLAIFTGNVDAVQGDMHLKADKVTVHYRNDANAEAKAEAAGATTGGTISKIVAEGHVFVSSPRETGQGDVGVYDVDAHKITLEGKQVVLTQGKNVIHGTRAVMNLATGRSVVTKGGGRVHGLFVPNKKQGQGN